jgi:hypothetical protein
MATRAPRSDLLCRSPPRFAFDVVALHGANGMATSMHPAFAERGTKIAECEAKSVGPK